MKSACFIEFTNYNTYSTRIDPKK